MALRNETYRVTDKESRDYGKAFFIQEMPSAQAEMWALRAFLAMAHSGIDIPDSIRDMGMAGLASFGLSAIGKMKFEDARILMDEMWECVQAIPEPSKPNFTRAVVDSDIEDVATRLQIRARVLKLHFDFLKAVARSTSASQAAASEESN